MMKNIIVTGATSFIGVHLIEKLLSNNCNVTCIVRPNSKNIYRLPVADSRLKIIDLGLLDFYKLSGILEENYDVFYHLAWEGARMPHRDNTELQEKNYDASMMAAKVAKKLNCKKFIGIGSQAEYSKLISSVEVVDESYSTNPSTEYGKYKLMACQDIYKFARDNNMEFIWARIFSVYGKYDFDKTLVSSCLKKFMNNEEIDLTECTQTWNFTFVEDIAQMLCLLGIGECEDGIYNIANSECKSLKQYILEIKSILNSSSKVNFGAIPYSSNEGIVNLYPCVDKLLNTFKSIQFTSFYDGILKTIK